MREIPSPLNGFRSPFGKWYAAGSSVFSPAILFANGEQGVWYDPSDLTTLFQDTAGTTPVTTAGQTVALMLDKSKGLALGPELFSDFTSEGEWIDNGGGSWTVTNATASTDLRVDFSGTLGKSYKISYTVDATANLLVYSLNTSPSVRATGTYTNINLSNVGFLIFRATPGTTATISNISVKELPGYHATQPTAAARPTYQTDGTYRWLSFDGVDDTMVTSAFIQTGGGFYAAHGFNVLSEGGNSSVGDSFGSLSTNDRESVGWRSSGTYQFGSQLRVKSGALYATNFTITGSTGSFGNNYVGDGWHDGLTLNARLSNGQSSSLAAEEAATGTPKVLTLANDSNYRFFGGIFRDGPPPSSDTRDRVQQYLADKTGVTL